MPAHTVPGASTGSAGVSLLSELRNTKLSGESESDVFIRFRASPVLKKVYGVAIECRCGSMGLC